MSESVVFDRAADYYDSTRGFPPGEDKHIGALLAQVGGWNQHSRILEIAIGTGRIAVPLVPLVRKVFGVDLSLPMMSRIRTKPGGDLIALTQADITKLPFGNHSVDGAVAVHVFHLLTHWRDALAELTRVLQPGAVLVHGRSSRWDMSREMWESVYKSVPGMARTVGADTREDDQFLLDEGWTQQGEIQTYTMAVEDTPRTFLNQIRNRTWSRSWTLTDEEINAAADVAEREILKKVSSLDDVVSGTMICRAAAYLPPQP